MDIVREGHAPRRKNMITNSCGAWLSQKMYATGYFLFKLHEPK